MKSTLPRVLVTTGTVRRLLRYEEKIPAGYIFQDGLLRKIRAALEERRREVRKDL